MNQELEALLKELATLTHGKATGAITWYYPRAGFLGCLMDTRGERIAQTITWDYAPTLTETVASLRQIAVALGEAE